MKFISNYFVLYDIKEPLTIKIFHDEIFLEIKCFFYGKMYRKILFFYFEYILFGM